MRKVGRVPIKEASQAFTNTWEDYGSLQPGSDVVGVALNTTITVGASTGMQVRIVAVDIAGGAEHPLPLATPEETLISVRPALYQYGLNDSQKLLIDFNFNHRVLFWKVQIKDAAGGGGTMDRIIAKVETD